MQRKPTWVKISAVILVPQMLLQSLVLPALAIPSERIVLESEDYPGEPLPVDLRAGAVVLAVEDFRVGHDRLPLALGRVYRSDMDQSEPGLFGHKWHSLLDMRIGRDGETLAMRDEQGRPRVYVPREDGTWVSVKYECEAIRRNADGEWERHLKSGVVYRFDAEGRLAEITDPNGRFLRITRLDNIEGPDEARGGAIRLEDRYGRFIKVALGENGRALTASDSAGRRCVYMFDEADNLRAFINHAGGAMTLTYDDANRLTELNGAVEYTLAYAKDGRVSSQCTGRGVIARYNYSLGADDAVGCRITDAVGGVSRIAFAADGKVTVTDSTGVAENLWLNERELPVRVAGSDGRTVEIRYDERANPVEIVRDGVAIRLRHAPDNTLTAVESDTGASLTFAYDQRRNVTTVENQRGARSVFEWDRHGLLRSAQGPTGSAVTLDYDAHGQVNAIRTGDGQTISLNFDTLGLLRELTTPTGVDYRYAYDLAGRLTGVENSEGWRVRLERDAQGRVVRVLDAAGNLTRMAYDPAGLLTLVRDPVGAVTRIDYDALGRPEAYADSNENVTRWSYDAAGRLLGEVDALGEAATLAYDAQGRLSRQVNRRGQATAIRYDDAGRMAGFDQAGVPAAFAYDAYGRAIGMSNPDSDFAFSLTPDGLIERVTDRKAGLAVAYEYDAAGRRVGMTAGDETVRYAYDAHGRLTAIESSAGRVSFEYDAAGRRSVMQYPNSVRTSYTYDKLNRIVEIRAVAADGQDVSRFRYTYDVLGNRTQMIEGEDRCVNYTYDAASRLVRVTESDKVTEYIYDDVGNRISVLVNGEREDYFTGKDNRLLKAGGAEFEYDADGNMTARTTADGEHYTFRYDAANRLIEAEGPEGTVVYAYAPNGARVTRAEDGETTRFVFDHEDVVFELVDGKVAARYLHGPGIDEPLAIERGEDSAFYHADALGTVHRLSGADGDPVGRYRYDAFGRLIVSESTVANTFTYTGRKWDPAADLYFYRARFFNPEIGRFTAKDPLGFVDGANQYTYVQNNPILFADPTGTVAWFVPSVVGAGVGGAISGGSYLIQHVNWDDFMPRDLSGYTKMALNPLYIPVYIATHVKPSFEWGDMALYTGGGMVAGAAAPIGWAVAAGAGISGIGAAALAGSSAVIGGLVDTSMQAIADDRELTNVDILESVFFSGMSFGLGEGLKALGLLSKPVGRNAKHLYSILFGKQTQKIIQNTILKKILTKSIKYAVMTSGYSLVTDSIRTDEMQTIVSEISELELRQFLQAMGHVVPVSMGMAAMWQLFLEATGQHTASAIDPSQYTPSGQAPGGTHQSPAPLTTTPYQWPAPHKWPAPLRW